MQDLKKQFEKTGYSSWINSEIYPDGKIYTKEYTEWLEKQLEKKPKQTSEKIIEAIADWLSKETEDIFEDKESIVLGFGIKNRAHYTHDGFCKEIASELYQAINDCVLREIFEAFPK